MAIKSITIENFKGIRDPLRIDLKPINLFYGPNSAGKSSIIHALHYALEVFDRKNFDCRQTQLGGPLVNLGGFDTFVHKGNKGEKIRFEFEFSYHRAHTYYLSVVDTGVCNPLDEWIGVGYASGDLLQVDIEIEFEKRFPIISIYSVWKDGVLLAQCEPDKNQVDENILCFLNLKHPHLVSWVDRGVNGEDNFKNSNPLAKYIRFHRNDSDSNLKLKIPGNKGNAMPVFDQSCPGEVDEPEFLSLCAEYNMPVNLPFEERNAKGIFNPDDEDTIAALASLLVVAPGELVRNELRKLISIGPFREKIARNFEPWSVPEKWRWFNGLAAWDILSRPDTGCRDEVNEWLNRKDRLNTGYQVEYENVVELSEKGPEYNKLCENSEGAKGVSEILSTLQVKTKTWLYDRNCHHRLKPQDV